MGWDATSTETMAGAGCVGADSAGAMRVRSSRADSDSAAMRMRARSAAWCARSVSSQLVRKMPVYFGPMVGEEEANSLRLDVDSG